MLYGLQVGRGSTRLGIAERLRHDRRSSSSIAALTEIGFHISFFPAIAHIVVLSLVHPDTLFPPNDDTLSQQEHGLMISQS